MTTVFISGSREIPYLPEESRIRIDRIMQQGFDVVVGDSERGVDAKVTEYLADCGYGRVTIYTIHDRPRVKSVLDFWRVRKIEPAVEKKIGPDGRVRNARELEIAKDEAMGAASDYGLVIWKDSFTNRFGRPSASKGSLRNMHQLLASGKPVVLYRLVDDGGAGTAFNCIEMRRVGDLQSVVDGCPAVVQSAYADIVKRYDKPGRGQGTGMQLKLQE